MNASSESPSSTPAVRATRWRWLSRGLLLLLFSPILVVLIWYLNIRTSNSRAVARLEAEVRQRGEPLSSVELKSLYAPIPDDLNAAIPLLDIWEKDEPDFWRAFRAGTRPLPERASKQHDPALPILGSSASRLARGAALDPQSLALAKEYLSKEAAHLAEVSAALQRPKARFPLEFTDTFNMLLAHLPALKQEAQNFRLAALVAADQGDVDASIAALRDAARVGQVLADAPLLIDQLVRIACLAIAINAAEDLLSRQSLTAPQLQKLKSLLEEMKTEGALKLALTGERALALTVFKLDARTAAALASDPDATSSSASSGGGMRAGIVGMKIIGLAAADHRLMLETFKDAIASTELESPGAVPRMEKVFQRASTEAGRFPPKIFSRLLLPAFGRTETKFAAQEARRQTALVAVAVERYRLQHNGKLPERLNQLVPQFLPDVPADPFDGQPLRFRALEKGYVVYSIGADLSDDGGKERKAGKGGNQNIDDTFIVER